MKLVAIAGAALVLSAGAAGSARAQAPAPAPAVAAEAGVKALLHVDNQEKELFLVRISGAEVFFRLPNAPAGALAAVKVDSVTQADFAFEYDEYKAFDAALNRRWAEAAGLILQAVGPCLPFLALRDNNAAEHALQAGLYQYRAAAAAARSGADGADARSRQLFGEALATFRAVEAAAWLASAEDARLRSAMCLVQLGRLEEAQKVLDAARAPEVGDAGYGLYWLARAEHLLASAGAREAYDAAVRSVVFETKNPDTFPDALLLTARCAEEILDYYRARDIYFEVARLFARTEWGDVALDKLRYIMDNKLTAEEEKVNIAKVFFGSEEDMNAVATEFLAKRPEAEKKSE